jgi:Tfp pilus assembly protein PilX
MLNRKGYALLVVLAVSVILSASAIALWSSANLDMMIAANNKRINQAKIAATSGLNHFISLGLSPAQLANISRESGIVIPNTNLTSKTFYNVNLKTVCCNSERYIITSTGYYKKGNKIIAEYPMRSSWIVQ